MDTEPKTRRPKHYEPKLSLYPMKFEDALRLISKAKPERKVQKKPKG